MQPDLFELPPARYPGHAGFKEKTTSLDAAIEVEKGGRAARLRDGVLAQLAFGPQTADEIAAAMGESPLAIRPRVSELKTDGKIEPTTDRRENASGMSARVWKLKGAR